jgi:simple sugar transport system substrate-binding protein/ribose transport system substrate-binding protein
VLSYSKGRAVPSPQVNRSTPAAFAVTALLAGAVLSGCVQAVDPDAGKPVVGMDYPRSDTDFWNSYIGYVPTFAKREGLQLRTANSQNDVDRLITNVQTFLGQDIQAMVMAPQDTEAIAPTLSTLAAKRIPVVTVDTRPDKGDVYMVVRADNRAYGVKACQFLGTKLHNTGKVVMLEGALSSINGRDRTEGFNDCMKEHFPGITVYGEETDWKGDVAAAKLDSRLTADPAIRGVYMQASYALSATLQVLEKHRMLVPPSDPDHVFVVSNDGVPEELKQIKMGNIDATVNQPADEYARYALLYANAAISGKTFKAGPTDHGSTIVQVRAGVLEDQLSAPLITADGMQIDGAATLTPDDPGLWANTLG